MPVLITGASGAVGTALARALAGTGQVRAFVRRDDPELRALGCHVAVGDVRDEGRLEYALEQVHTIVHLAEDWSEGAQRGVVEPAESAVRAAQGAEVVRFLYVSCAGADASSDDSILVAKARVEELVRTSGLEHAILRCAPLVGAGSWLDAYFTKHARSILVPVPGSGRQRLNPLALGDLVRALVRADAREQPVSGTWELGGPDLVTFDELVRAALGRKRLMHRRGGGLPSAWARDAIADAASAVEQFGLEPTPLADALARR